MTVYGTTVCRYWSKRPKIRENGYTHKYNHPQLKSMKLVLVSLASKVQVTTPADTGERFCKVLSATPCNGSNVQIR